MKVAREGKAARAVVCAGIDTGTNKEVARKKGRVEAQVIGS